MLQPSVPELIEDDHNPAVELRTESLPSLRELGPPDLVHLTKQSSKSSTRQTGVYHHVTGVDASSSASLAAYVNTLIYNPQDKSKVTAGLYCCYNGKETRASSLRMVSLISCAAFSRLDVRVSVTIPGGVESYCIDEQGRKTATTEEMWLETLLCSFCRAYSYSDSGNGERIKEIVGLRRFNPVTTTDQEHRMLDASERLFFKGWMLGSDPEIQIPSTVNNHLTSNLLKYFETTGRYASGINLFEKLRSRDPEISCLLARLYFLADEEVNGVTILHDTIQDLPMDYALLDTQADFCKSKGELRSALELAKISVTAAPSENITWSRLAQVYIAREEWELALRSLNGSPMFTYQDKDAPTTGHPVSMKLPVMPESQCEEIEDPDQGSIEPVSPALRKLPAQGFKGTFEKAYGLLTQIARTIGWDQLLQIRSQVFLMETEYQRHSSVQGNGSNGISNGKSSPASTADGTGDGASSTVEGPGASPDASTHALNGASSPGLPKPSNTVDTKSAHIGADNSTPTTPATTHPSFQQKVLSERWLDNLFMVLYEDLRVYTIWRTEMAQHRAQGTSCHKSAEEWEILGSLAQRLHYHEEAVEAWRECLSVRFSPKAMSGVMESWQRVDGNSKQVVGALCRLICWQYRWYSEFSPRLYTVVRKLIENDGALKVQSLVKSTPLPPHVLELTENYVRVLSAFRSKGSADGY